MKTAGLVLLVLGGLIMLLGVGGAVLKGPEAFEGVRKSVEDLEPIESKEMTQDTEVILENVAYTFEPGTPGFCYAILELDISSTESISVTDEEGGSKELPLFEIPYSIVVFDDAGTQIAKEEGTLTAAKDMEVMVSDADADAAADAADDASTNTALRMTVRRQITIDEIEASSEKGGAVTEKKVQVRAKFGADVQGKATVNSAKVEVYVWQIPMEEVLGMLGALGGVLCGACGGGTLGLVGLILLIVGVSQGKQSTGPPEFPS